MFHPALESQMARCSARFLLFPAHRVGRRRFRVGLRGHVRRRKDGTGLFLSSSVTRGGFSSPWRTGEREQAGFWRRDKTQCRYHQDLFLFRRFCATAPTIFNHTLHGIKHPSNWPFVFISSSNFRRSKLSCKFFFYDVVSVKLPILYYFWKVKTEKMPIFLVDGKFSFVSLEILECFFLLRDFFL